MTCGESGGKEREVKQTSVERKEEVCEGFSEVMKRKTIGSARTCPKASAHTPPFSQPCFLRTMAPLGNYSQSQHHTRQSRTPQRGFWAPPVVSNDVAYIRGKWHGND